MGGHGKGTCSVEGCGRRHEARGYCNRHYKRLLRYGNPVYERPTLADRFWAKVERGDGDECWVWVGANSHGYGHLSRGARGSGFIRAHVLSYEIHVGPVPSGLELDHLCRNRACVNPGHLEAVTPAENKRRGESPAARNARKTHCKNGHEFTPENTWNPPSGNRQCKTCSRASVVRWRERHAG